jgi:sec-independent protein translocase protein TatC
MDLNELNNSNRGVASEQDDSSASHEVKPFLDHLEDLRTVLLKSLLAITVSAVICFFFTDQIVAFFKGPLLSMAKTSEAGQEMTSRILRSLHPADFLMASFKLSAIVGLVLASPLVCYWFWGFVSPGLRREERRIGLPIFFSGLICFLLGVAFCYLVVLKLSLNFLWDYTLQRGVVPEWTFDNYISFVSTMMIAFGVTFEMPVITTLLTKFGLLTQSTLKSKRRYAYLAMVILAAVLTPPDVISQTMLCVPMVILYEISIWVAGLIENDRV